MSPHVQIRLLGDFCLMLGGAVDTRVGTTRMQALLGFLLLRRGTPQSRAYAAFQFWPDSSEKQALTNLRHLLHQLRRALPEIADFVRTDSRSVWWDHDAETDVDAFAAAIGRAKEARQRADHAEVQNALESAVALYRGDLLPGCYGVWIEDDRARLRQDAITALEQLVSVAEERRDYVSALQHARHLREIEPTRESTHARLMHLCLLAGDRAGALRTYEECVATLQRELHVGPGSAVRNLRERALVEAPDAVGLAPPAPGLAGAPALSLRGRDAEWRRMLSAWQNAVPGRAGVVVIAGEAGIGKSRLAAELCVWAQRQGATVGRTRAYAAEGRLALAPAAEWLRTPALRRALDGLDPVWRAEVARLLPELRAPGTATTAPSDDGLVGQRHHLFEALSRAILASGDPLLLLLDDLQWTDQETLEWLRFLLRFAPAARLLLVGTVRTEDLPVNECLQRLLTDLRRDDVLVQIDLGPLSVAEAATVAADVAGRELQTEEVNRLYAETEGNPLFVVERVRAGWKPERGADTASGTADAGAALPPKVHAVITMRLAQLSRAARELAGVAAVTGRAFSFAMLQAAWERREEETLTALEELLQRSVVREHQAETYDFTHDKLREVAYAAISRPRRRLLHRRVAGALAGLRGEAVDAVRAQIAAHLEAAGLVAESVTEYQLAAEAAKNLHASEEAIRLFQKALALLATLPAMPARAEQELQLHTSLGVCLVASQGYPASRVWGIYERAVDLCRQLGRATEPPILRALAIASLTSGDLRRAHALGEELRAIHARTGEAVVQVEAEYVLGVSCFWLGRFAESRSHLEAALAAYNPQTRSTHISLYAQDPKAICLARLAWTWCYLGHPDRARQTLDAALAFAREVDHPHTEAYVTYFGAQLCLDLRDHTRAAALLGALDRLTSRHALAFWEYRGRILNELERARTAGTRSAVVRARECMATYAGIGNLVNFSQFLGYVAALYLAWGEVDDGRAAIAEAFQLLDRIDERYYCAELHRLDGELRRAGGANPDEVESCFQRALDTARQQGARFYALRAANSLSRLWYETGRRAAAREQLATTCSAFADGGDTSDLRDAKASLARWA